MFRVTNQPIDLNELVAYVTDPEAGAIVPFIGTTRNSNEGRKVIALDYEAYPEMAEKELARLGDDAKTKWPICKMAIVHRLVPVQIGETSVITSVSAAPRDAACGVRRLPIVETKKTAPNSLKGVFAGGGLMIGTPAGPP